MTALKRPFRRQISRYNLSFFAAWVLTMVFASIALRREFMTITDGETALQFITIFYLVFWSSFVTIFNTWTRSTLRGRSPNQLRDHAKHEAQDSQKRWVRWGGFKGATGLSITAGGVSMVLAIMLTRFEFTREGPVWLLLGAWTAAASWEYMVMMYASDYMELDLKEDDVRHIRFHYTDEPIFDDYLSLAAFTSIMGTMSPAEPTTRKGWKMVRSNAIVAFVFNTLVIAVVVAMITTGLTE